MSYTDRAAEAWAQRQAERARQQAQREAHARLREQTERLLCANQAAVVLHVDFAIDDPPGPDDYHFHRGGWATWVAPEDGIDLFVIVAPGDSTRCLPAVMVYLSSPAVADPCQAGQPVADLADLGRALAERPRRLTNG